jgi:hypothetical protein
MKNLSLGLLIPAMFFLSSVNAQMQMSHSSHDGHAPISVMGEHYHAKGDWMLSYRFMPMWMNGSINGSDDLSISDIHQSYMVAPINMTMQMHMMGAMYAVSDNITLMIMSNYLTNEMELQTRPGGIFSTKSSGFGDFSATALIKVLKQEQHSIHTNIGLSMPTGNINKRDDTPMMENVKLAYPMQLGSGTVDPILGFTYLGHKPNFSWGLQMKYKMRIGENDQNYLLGDDLNLSTWCVFQATKVFSFSSSLYYNNIQSISGADLALNPNMMPLFDSLNSGRDQIDFGLGINYHAHTGHFQGVRVGLELNLPVYQKTEGVQMKNLSKVTAGIQFPIGHHQTQNELNSHQHHH